jgi:hypothetical protein
MEKAAPMGESKERRARRGTKRGAACAMYVGVWCAGLGLLARGSCAFSILCYVVLVWAWSIIIIIRHTPMPSPYDPPELSKKGGLLVAKRHTWRKRTLLPLYTTGWE